MKNIDRRLDRVEEKLGLKKEKRKSVIIVTFDGDDEPAALPESVEDWITYQEQFQQTGRQPLFVFTAKEAKAQARVTKQNKNSTK